jgi:lipopolysaccharide cholinephosphotransferase
MKNKNKFDRDNLLKECGEKLNLEQIHELLFEMLKDFDIFCKSKGIEYCLGAGTLLGAIRHKGFIPWDDDADIYMTRDNYNKLLEYSAVNERIQIVSPQNDHGFYHPFPYVDLSESRTIHISHGMRYETGKGQFIDIFPLDGIPDSAFSKHIHLMKLRILSRLRDYSIRPMEKVSSARQLIINCCVVLARLFDGESITNSMVKLIQKYSYEDTKLVGLLVFGGRDHFVWNRDWFKSMMECDFFVPGCGGGYNITNPLRI